MSFISIDNSLDISHSLNDTSGCSIFGDITSSTLSRDVGLHASPEFHLLLEVEFVEKVTRMNVQTAVINL